MDLITPLTIGLIGSMHCLGMCGPIVVALPLKKHNLISKVSGTLLYNFGRVFTYGLIGTLFGVLGNSLKLAGLQQWTSIILGIALILSVLWAPVFGKKITISSLFSGAFSKLIIQMKKLFSNRSYFSLFMIGFLNGFLPCGLVYVAVAGAISTGGILLAAIYMMLFGLGTIPMLMTATLASDLIGQKIRSKMQRIVPYFIFLVGILFILRGMSLGIPYISPTTEKLTPQEVVEKGDCCK